MASASSKNDRDLPIVWTASLGASMVTSVALLGAEVISHWLPATQESIGPWLPARTGLRDCPVEEELEPATLMRQSRAVNPMLEQALAGARH